MIYLIKAIDATDNLGHFFYYNTRIIKTILILIKIHVVSSILWCDGHNHHQHSGRRDKNKSCAQINCDTKSRLTDWRIAACSEYYLYLLHDNYAHCIY